MLKFWDFRGRMLKKELTTKTSCSAISNIGIITQDNDSNNDENNNNNNNNNIIITNHYNGLSNIYSYNIPSDINNIDKPKHLYTIKPSQLLIGYQTKCAISRNNNNNNNNISNSNIKDNLNDNNSEDSDISDSHIYDKNVAITSNDGSITMYSYTPTTTSSSSDYYYNNTHIQQQQQQIYNNYNNLSSSQQSMVLSHSVKIECHKRAVTCVDFHPNNITFLTGSLDSHIKLWYKSI